MGQIIFFKLRSAQNIFLFIFPLACILVITSTQNNLTDDCYFYRGHHVIEQYFNFWIAKK